MVSSINSATSICREQLAKMIVVVEATGTSLLPLFWDGVRIFDAQKLLWQLALGVRKPN